MLICVLSSFSWMSAPTLARKPLAQCACMCKISLDGTSSNRSTSASVGESSLVKSPCHASCIPYQRMSFDIDRLSGRPPAGSSPAGACYRLAFVIASPLFPPAVLNADPKDRACLHRPPASATEEDPQLSKTPPGECTPASAATLPPGPAHLLWRSPLASLSSTCCVGRQLSRISGFDSRARSPLCLTPTTPATKPSVGHRIRLVSNSPGTPPNSQPTITAELPPILSPSPPRQTDQAPVPADDAGAASTASATSGSEKSAPGTSAGER